MAMKLELVIVPVSDVDRALAFYRDGLGFVEDHDVRPAEGVRVVQLTPPGSACSIAIGEGITTAAPGSTKALQVVVDDADPAQDGLAGRGVEVTDVEELAWGRFVSFTDPDGNAWAVQELPKRGG